MSESHSSRDDKISDQEMTAALYDGHQTRLHLTPQSTHIDWKCTWARPVEVPHGT